MEKELRDYLLYLGQADFYEEMMKERRRIRQVRLLQAKAKAERRAFIINMLTVGITVLVGSVIVVGLMVAILS